MLKSMTGFGSAAAEADGCRVTVEVRSVNHRYLQAKLRLPQELGELEGELEAVVKKRLSRGSVNLTAKLELGAGEVEMQFDAGRIAQVRAHVELLAAELGYDVKELGLTDWLRVQALFTSQAAPVEIGPAANLLRRAVGEALDGLVAMREREGEALARDLVVHAEALAAVRARVAERAPDLVTEHFAKLRERVAELAGPDSRVEPGDLARELALIADKGDLSEELSRLEAHQVELQRMLCASEPTGRQLDFLVQELLREVNTVGSKCSDATVAHWVVEAKTHVERLREQVQNVE